MPPDCVDLDSKPRDTSALECTMMFYMPDDQHKINNVIT